MTMKLHHPEQRRGEQVVAIDSVDTGVRGGPEPGAITLEAFGRGHPRGVTLLLNQHDTGCTAITFS
jgi:hypothetical protein